MKKVLFVAVLAICAMGCCKKTDHKCCCKDAEAPAVEAVAEEAPAEEAPAEEAVEAPAAE